MIDQSKAWRTQSLWALSEVDDEVDDCDSEDADPEEAKAATAGNGRRGMTLKVQWHRPLALERFLISGE